MFFSSLILFSFFFFFEIFNIFTDIVNCFNVFGVLFFHQIFFCCWLVGWLVCNVIYNKIVRICICHIIIHIGGLTRGRQCRITRFLMYIKLIYINVYLYEMVFINIRMFQIINLTWVNWIGLLVKILHMLFVDGTLTRRIKLLSQGSFMFFFIFVVSVHQVLFSVIFWLVGDVITCIFVLCF